MAQISDEPARTYDSREHVLNLWAEGKTSPEIVERVPGVDGNRVESILAAARYRRDPRAAKRYQTTIEDATRERILDAHGSGKDARAIAGDLDLVPSTVRWVLERARMAGDERAAKHVASVEEPPPAPDREFPAETRDVYSLDATVLGRPRPVSVRAVSLTRHDPLRPLKDSIERARQTGASMTAVLMGDPPPHRSALGRECRPEEYASRGGEGRYRDPYLGACSGSLTGRIGVRVNA